MIGFVLCFFFRAGRSRYRFVVVKQTPIIPDALLAEIEIPDSTPGIVNRYSWMGECAYIPKDTIALCLQMTLPKKIW
jgi:hypothetical protein